MERGAKKEIALNTVIVNPKRFVLILAAVLLTYGAHGISYGDELAPEEIAQTALRSTVLIKTESSLGSGFVVGDGQVATNHHVIEGMIRGTVQLVNENTEHPIESVLGVDWAQDLAVIEVSGLRAPILPFGDSDAVQVGQAVYAVGNPQGLQGTFSPGVISAIRPEGNSLVAGKVLQITAPISPGSSGGPVLDSNAEVIGIAVGTRTQGQNLNFAIPVNFLKELLKRIEDGTVLPPITQPTTGSFIYWTDVGRKTIQRANLDGSNLQTLVSRGLVSPYGIAVDVAGGKMYWTDYDTDRIQCANLDGSNVQTLVARGLENPAEIALDVTGGKMYWTDWGEAGTGARFGKQNIKRANLDGSNIETLVTSSHGIYFPEGIALAVAGGKMYWTDYSADRIQRANLDGSNVQTLVALGLEGPRGIAVDAAGGKMYWTDYDAGRIQRANLDGSNVQTIVTRGLESPNGIALDVAGGKMYWTDYGETGVGARFGAEKIQRANLDGSNIETLVTRAQGLTALGHIAVGVAPKPPPVVQQPDLVVEQPTVSKSTLAPGESFTLSATVSNNGDGSAAATTLRYYRSTDATITTGDTAVGTDSVGALAANGSGAENITLTAPTAAGTYYYGACVESVMNESRSDNNCSASVSVTVQQTPMQKPDLVVERPTVSKSMLTPGETFTLSVTVSNEGDASAAATTLRYYRSTDVTITTGDTEVGTDSVGALAANGSGAENITLTAPNSPGTYYYGACVVSVSNESDKTNNCSDAVSITVGAEATEPSLSVSAASPLTEAVLDGSEVTLTLADGAFEQSLSTIRSAVTISGIAGVSVGTVRRVSDTEIDIVLDFDGTDFDADATLTFSVGAGAVADYSGSSLTATRSVTAVVEVVPLAIYWIDRGTNSIRATSLDGLSNEGIVTRGLKTPKGLALDITSGQVYWTDSGTDKIQRADLDGSNIEDLVTQGLEVTSDIALDVTGGKMYWTDSGTDKIQRADLDGSNVEDLVTQGLKNPRGLALDISSGHMYWTDKDTDKIQRADLDGSNVQDLVTRGLQLTTDLALDVMGGKMYWTDVGTGKIQRANLDGSNVEDLVTGLPGPNGITLDAAGRTMYWTDWRTNKIQRAELNGSNVETVVSSSVNSPSSIAVAASALPPSIDPEDETEFQAEDANRDGTVDIQDIVFIAQRFNQTGQSNADVNGDEIVDVLDILAVAAVLVDNVSAAPSLRAHLPNDITAATIQQWLTEAELTGKITPVYRRGILVLEQLLAALTPEDTVLLANYPNPFNPETWIPYRLATDADVKLTIYDTQGVVVRQLALGHQQAGFYTDRTKAAYWDGRNAVGERVASGVYFYQLRAGDYTAIRNMLILK